MKTDVKDVGLIVFGIFMLVAVFLSLQRVDSFLKIKAIDDCGKISRYEANLDEVNARVTYPLDDIYKACLKDKGIE